MGPIWGESFWPIWVNQYGPTWGIPHGAMCGNPCGPARLNFMCSPYRLYFMGLPTWVTHGTYVGQPIWACPATTYLGHVLMLLGAVTMTVCQTRACYHRESNPDSSYMRQALYQIRYASIMFMLDFASIYFEFYLLSLRKY